MSRKIILIDTDKNSRYANKKLQFLLDIGIDCEVIEDNTLITKFPSMFFIKNNVTVKIISGKYDNNQIKNIIKEMGWLGNEN